jgi:hypothetical protein
MFTHTPHSGPRGALCRTLQIVLLASLCPWPSERARPNGRRVQHGRRRRGAQALEEARHRGPFPRESYRPGAVARLVIFSKQARNVSVQIFHAGTEHQDMKPRDEMYGTAVTDARYLGTVRQGRAIVVSIPNSPSGLYFAKLTGSGNRVGYAPFVLRPRRLGENPVAVVLPTLAWQAYNFRDDNRDGQADTWYASAKVKSVLLGRPFDQRGVPPNYKYYEQPFLRWLIAKDRAVDYLAQSDVAAANGRKLAASYNLLIFSGHHEYVTDREYDAVVGFRNRGGNLMFLSANNFSVHRQRRRQPRAPPSRTSASRSTRRLRALHAART